MRWRRAIGALALVNIVLLGFLATRTPHRPQAPAPTVDNGLEVPEPDLASNMPSRAGATRHMPAVQPREAAGPTTPLPFPALQAEQTESDLDPPDPGERNPAFRAAVAKAALDRPGAERAFTRLLRLDPRNAAAHSRLAGLLFADGDTTGAERHSREAVRLSPDTSRYRANLGLVLAARGAYEAAEHAYRAAIARNSKNASARSNLASLLFRRGDVAGVQRQMEALLEAYPADSYAYDVLARLWARNGNLAGAEELLATYLEQADSVRKPAAREFYFLATVRVARGDRGGAEAAVRRALEGGGLSKTLRARARTLLDDLLEARRADLKGR